MTVVSGAFLLFLCITMGVYYAFPSTYRWLVLLAASIVFYVMAGRWEFLPCIFLTSLVVWLGARRLAKLDGQLKAQLAEAGKDKARKKALRGEFKSLRSRTLVGVLVLCIGVLCVTKFSRVVIPMLDGIVARTSTGVHVDPMAIVMPLGISYYTFSTVGYLLDVYWHRYEAEVPSLATTAWGRSCCASRTSTSATSPMASSASSGASSRSSSLPTASTCW